MAKGGKRPGAGRKKGVPNKVTRDVKALAQNYAPEAFEALKLIATSGMSEAARVAAIKEILDRAYGKSQQAVVGDPDNPIHVKHSRIEFAIVGNSKG
jgi:hypothetical protein